jgi:hypothetical protein
VRAECAVADAPAEWDAVVSCGLARAGRRGEGDCACVQCLACSLLSLAEGARQLWPWRNPLSGRVMAIFSSAAADNVK